MKSTKFLSMDINDAVSKWDLIVILSGNETMTCECNSYLKWLNTHQNLSLRNVIALADPPGPRIESFGAIAAFIQYLENNFKDEYQKWKILALMSGGFNKRMPFCIYKGKLFKPLPCSREGSLTHIFDLKVKLLSVYLPIMPEGSIMVTASDDIETYDFELNDLKMVDQTSITAIGHFSSLDIGMAHGVYVVEKEQLNDNKLITTASCKEVLQKPSQNLMEERGAILSSNGTNVVLTDSVFWITKDAVEKIHRIWLSISPLQCEVDIYRDLLQCCGAGKSKHYIDSLKNENETQNKVSKLDEYQRIISKEFRNTPLTVLVEKQSTFYHFGTTKEYLYLLCEDEKCQQELNFSRVSCTTVKHAEAKTCGVMMYSIIEGSFISHHSSVVEFCHISSGIIVQENVILSHCRITGTETITIPANITMFTIPIDSDAGLRFCTVAFGYFDDTKSKIRLDYDNCTFLNIKIRSALDCLNLSSEDVMSLDGKTLWDLCIFPVTDKMESSFFATMNMVRKLSRGKSFQQDCIDGIMSLNMCVERKNFNQMMKFEETFLNHLY